jgi:hypothetical protein
MVAAPCHAGTAYGQLKRLQIGRPMAGYKACNMLTIYGWRKELDKKWTNTAVF